jgi:hypothetical protein
MGTGELHKGQPILTLLAPAGANTAALGQPSQGAFHDPAPRGMLLHFRDGLRWWLAAAPPMRDVLVIARFRDQRVHILEIIAFVQTQMLLRGRARHHDGDKQVVHRPFVVLIGAGDVHGQRGATLVNQDVDLGAALAAVRWVTPSGCTAQRRRNRFAVERLPLPAHTSPAGIEADQSAQDLLPDALLLPGLQAFVQDATGDAEPIAVDGFPLAAGPENVPDTIDNGPIVRARPSRTTSLRRSWQLLFDEAPQRSRNLKVIDILRFCATLVFTNGTPRWTVFLGKDNCPRGVSFFTSP